MIMHGASQDALSLSIASTGYYFLSQFCTEIYQKYKTIGVRIELIEGHVNHIADMVSSGSAGLGIVHLWTCYKNSYLKQIHAKKLQYYPIAALDVAVTVSRNNPLFFSESEQIAPEALASYPCVTYAYLDSGPYSDIYHRLRLRDSGSRIVTSSRSVIYEDASPFGRILSQLRISVRLCGAEHGGAVFTAAHAETRRLFCAFRGRVDKRK